MSKRTKKTIMNILLYVVFMIALIPTKSRAQCDEISYVFNTGPGTYLTFVGSTALQGVSWSWSACNTSLCFGATGQTALFEQFIVTDTIKACLTATTDSLLCNLPCDTLVWGGDGWEVMVPGVTGIRELAQERVTDDRMFDMLGREYQSYADIPIGIFYIRGGKVCVKISQ